MGAWVALVLTVQAAGTLPPALETRYFETSQACEAWARRITTPPGTLPPGTEPQLATCLHVRELIARLAQGR